MLNYNAVTFETSAHELSQLPEYSKGEVAIAGRSNAGKSSAINAITNIKGLAKTSKTPGRTQLINFFSVTTDRYIVDLPGYGYAKVSQSTKAHWNKTLTAYLESREPLRGVVLIMDIRHPLKPFDVQMLDWVTQHKIPVHILLTKADKLKNSTAKATFFAVQKKLEEYGDMVSIQLFSAIKKSGISQAKAKLNEWLTS